jgi:ubiquitin thioesterase protein OTUB1
MLIQLQNLLDESTGSDRPLIAAIAPMSVLRAEYENGSPSFVAQIDWLSNHGYKAVRRTRGSSIGMYWLGL